MQHLLELSPFRQNKLQIANRNLAEEPFGDRATYHLLSNVKERKGTKISETLSILREISILLYNG